LGQKVADTSCGPHMKFFNVRLKKGQIKPERCADRGGSGPQPAGFIENDPKRERNTSRAGAPGEKRKAGNENTVSKPKHPRIQKNRGKQQNHRKRAMDVGHGGNYGRCRCGQQEIFCNPGRKGGE